MWTLVKIINILLMLDEKKKGKDSLKETIPFFIVLYPEEDGVVQYIYS